MIIFAVYLICQFVNPISLHCRIGLISISLLSSCHICLMNHLNKVNVMHLKNMLVTCGSVEHAEMENAKLSKHRHTHTHTLVDSTSMNEECVAVDAVGSMPKLQLRVDRQVCAVRFLTLEDVVPRRPTSPMKHTQNPMAGKIRDDWWVQPSHGECRGSAWRG